MPKPKHCRLFLYSTLKKNRYCIFLLLLFLNITRFSEQLDSFKDLIDALAGKRSDFFYQIAFVYCEDDVVDQRYVLYQC